MDSVEQSPTQSDMGGSNDKEIKQMLTHNIVSSPDSNYTLEHKRQTPEEKKLIYCVRFEPDESKYLAIGSFYLNPHFRLFRWNYRSVQNRQSREKHVT